MTTHAASGPLTLVTGASAGIGRQLSLSLMSRGHRVIGIARRRERLQVISGEHPAFSPLEMDLTARGAPSDLCETVLEGQGLPDYLILNAGLAHYGQLHRITPRQVHEQITLNLLSVIQTTQAFLPHFLKRGSGRILIVSSVLGVGVIPYASTYCATKHGVIGFVRGLRVDLKGSGVSISALCPAGVETEFRQVATASADPKGMGQEPVERVVAGMVRHLDRDTAVIYPTPQAQVAGLMMSTFPRLTEWALGGNRGKYASLLPKERV